MEVINEVSPSDPARLQEIMEPGPEGPVFMINLLKFKERAEYEDGRQTDLTGREAYMIYGKAVTDLLPKFNGTPLFAANVTFLFLGQVEELWDEVAIVMYPTRADLLRMSTSPEWQEIAVHRTAGLKGQLNIETVLPKDGIMPPWIQAIINS